MFGGEDAAFECDGEGVTEPDIDPDVPLSARRCKGWCDFVGHRLSYPESEGTVETDEDTLNGSFLSNRICFLGVAVDHEPFVDPRLAAEGVGNRRQRRRVASYEQTRR